MEIKTFLKGYEIIHSGTVHLTDEYFRIEIAGLPVHFNFLKDTEGQRWAVNGKGTSVDIDLFNLNYPTPEGVLEPIAFASGPSGDLCFTFLSSLVDPVRRLRSFSYTILIKEKLNG